MTSSGPPPPPGGVLLLIVALSSERRAIRRGLPAWRRLRRAGIPLLSTRLGDTEIWLAQAGIGLPRARRLLLALGRETPLAGAWSLGFVGGLVPGLAAGDLLCPERARREREGAPCPPPREPGRILAALRAAGCRAHGGGLLTAASPLRTPEAKRQAASGSGAVAVDMEACGVAQAAAELGIPWLALKVVLDPVEAAFPPWLAGCCTPAGNPRLPGIVRALLAGSEARRALAGLGRSARQAAAALTRALGPALRAWAQLDAPGPLQ